MGWTYLEFRRQPARVIFRWTRLLQVQHEARTERDSVEATRAQLRAKVSN